jgi:hypothetical protein
MSYINTFHFVFKLRIKKVNYLKMREIDIVLKKIKLKWVKLIE